MTYQVATVSGENWNLIGRRTVLSQDRRRAGKSTTSAEFKAMRNWIATTVLSLAPLLALGATNKTITYDVNGQPYEGYGSVSV